MKSRTAKDFRVAFASLPEPVRDRARRAYRLFRTNPSHPSLRFKPVHPSKRIYSVRVGAGHRAVAVRAGDVLTWVWIGSHADYEKLLARR